MYSIGLHQQFQLYFECSRLYCQRCYKYLLFYKQMALLQYISVKQLHTL